MSFDYEKLLVFNELSEIIRWHNQCIDRLQSYRTNHPYLLAPNLGRMMEDNLKENVQMLYRELNNLNKPKAEQRRHVCRECFGVFASALPGGICDECRSRAGNVNQYETPLPQDSIATADPGTSTDEQPDNGNGEQPENQTEPLDSAEAAQAAAEIVEFSGPDAEETTDNEDPSSSAAANADFIAQ
jgi:hypothetical protein